MKSSSNRLKDRRISKPSRNTSIETRFAVLLVLCFSFRLRGDESRLVLTLPYIRTDFDTVHAISAVEAQVFSAVYEGLAVFHPATMEPVEAQASWTLSADRKTYKFTIRRDAAFENGDPVTAEIFRQSWLRLLDPAESAEYSFLLDAVAGAKEFRTGAVKDPASVGIIAAGERVLEVRLLRPTPYFLKLLCHHALVPLHPGRKRSPFQVLSNGPYLLEEYSRQRMLFKENPAYWDKDGLRYETLEIRFTVSDDDASRGFNTGEIQWLGDSFSLDSLDCRNCVYLNPMFSTQYFFFSCRRTLSNPDLRRALALALPWDILRSRSKVLFPSSVLIPKIPGYPEVQGLDSRDTRQSLKLLKEAGYEGGKGFPELSILVPESDFLRDAAGVFSDAWKSGLGIESSIEVVSQDEYYARLEKGDYDVAVMNWIGDFPDPMAFLQMWLSASNLNYASYRSDVFDRLIEQSLSETGTARYEALGKAEQLLLNEAVVLPISHTPALNVVDTEVLDGWFVNPLDIHPFKFLRPKPPVMGPGSI